MKIMIASDLHGSLSACRRMLDIFDASGAERLVLLGDLLYHGPRNDLPEGYDPRGVIAALSPYAARVLCVRGNCEAEVDQMVLPFPVLAETALLFVDGHTWVAVHGHRTDNWPVVVPGQVVLSGHTHIPVLERDAEGVVRVNPGSVAIPKGGFPASYGMYEDGEMEIMGLWDEGEIFSLNL